MKIKVSALLLAALLVCSFVLVSCDFGKTIDKDLVGTWSTTADKIDPGILGITDEDCEMLGIEIKDIIYSMRFDESGTGAMIISTDNEDAPEETKASFDENGTTNITWYTIGHTLYIAVEDEEEESTDYKIESDKFTMTDSDGTTLTLTKE